MSAYSDKAALSFRVDGADWPNRDSSRFVEAFGIRWHVQIMGQGPTLLLVHGTGAATHSWRSVAPILARRFQVVAMDLPGHGFTDRLKPNELSLPGMARALTALIKELRISPRIVVGHSAGAAILARLCIDRAIAPELLVSLNGALTPFDGVAGVLFPPLAKLLFLNPLAPRLFAWTADRLAVSRLLRGTGSVIDKTGIDLYSRLLANPYHVAGALGMMANWDLESLRRDIRRLKTPLALVVADGDKAVPPRTAQTLEAKVPHARVKTLRGVGHLAHEEQPFRVCRIIGCLVTEAGVIERHQSAGHAKAAPTSL
jgi:magnesium chelatase accessory protein